MPWLDKRKFSPFIQRPTQACLTQKSRYFNNFRGNNLQTCNNTSWSMDMWTYDSCQILHQKLLNNLSASGKPVSSWMLRTEWHEACHHIPTIEGSFLSLRNYFQMIVLHNLLKRNKTTYFSSTFTSTFPKRLHFCFPIKGSSCKATQFRYNIANNSLIFPISIELWGGWREGQSIQLFLKSILKSNIFSSNLILNSFNKLGLYMKFLFLGKLIRFHVNRTPNAPYYWLSFPQYLKPQLWQSYITVRPAKRGLRIGQ